MKNFDIPFNTLNTSQPGEAAGQTISNSRRRFLAAAGGASLAASLAPLSGNSTLTARAEIQSLLGPLSDAQRRRRAQLIRQQCAIFQTANGLAFPDVEEHRNNGDDEYYAARIGSFTKGLPHNALGEVDSGAYREYLRALRSGEPDDYERIPLGGAAKLADPQAALAYELQGLDSGALAIEPAPRLESETVGAEMAEIYWRALTRDVPYSLYDGNILIAAAISDLQRFSLFKDVTPATLFRGGLPGEQIGPLISQFLWQPIPYGAMTIRQQYRVSVPGDDYLTGYAAWLGIQNGMPPASGNVFDPTPRYIRNGRDLAEWDHRDFTYQGFLNAALILLGYGAAALDDGNPYKTSTRQSGFATFGGPHILDLVARVACQALKAAWFQKWQVHRRLRPEAYGGLVHHTRMGTARYPVNATLLNSAALGVTMSRHGTFLLPMAYPEGCPLHPAFPGGHATIAGACATVLKAFFKESFVLPNPVTASEDGTTLTPASDLSLTVGDELNKLASNVAYGRDAAGVHWRSDEVEGLKLGETLAISVLQDFNITYNERFEGFTLTKFDGTTVRLNQQPILSNARRPI